MTAQDHVLYLSTGINKNMEDAQSSEVVATFTTRILVSAYEII
jgi:hypothetical protein